jgi:hypothetical protein
MKHAIIDSGKIGTALARKNVEVAIVNSRHLFLPVFLHLSTALPLQCSNRESDAPHATSVTSVPYICGMETLREKNIAAVKGSWTKGRASL